MDDKEFRKWNKEQKKRAKEKVKKILTRRPGKWRIPDNF